MHALHQYIAEKGETGVIRQENVVWKISEQGQGKMGFVALLTHEDPEGSRSNDYAQILAVFGAKAFGYKLLDSKRVGGKLYWEVSLSALVDGDIHLNVMFYGNKDATCCPSIEGKATYILDKSNQLKETGTRILGIP